MDLTASSNGGATRPSSQMDNSASGISHFANDSAADFTPLAACEGHGILSKQDHQCSVRHVSLVVNSLLAVQAASIMHGGLLIHAILTSRMHIIDD